MPLLVPCDELQPEMQLVEPIVSNGRVMLDSGRALSQTDISTLQRRFDGLSVRVGDPVLDDVIDFEDDSRERDVADKTQQMVSESISQVQKRFAKRVSLRGADFDALRASVNHIMKFLTDSRTSTALITNCSDSNTYLSTHAGNVFYLSMLLGSKAIDYVVSERQRQTSARDLQAGVVKDLTPLGLGAMTIDLGLLPLQDLFKVDRPLSEAQRLAIRDHPIVGADMLPVSFPAVARMVVATHHENVAGSGYPRELGSEKLHVFTRIVRIADAYDAATSELVYKDARSPVRVLWEMLAGPYKRFYDPKLMAAFARLIQPFPIGAQLRLEDGRYAAVVKYNRENSFEPTVVIAFDADHRHIPREELEDPVDLSLHPDLRIKSFRSEDLSFIHGTEPETEAPAREKFTTLLQAAFP